MLELRQIKKTYRVGEIETKALQGVSLAFREQEFVAILGTSGSGKTTTLNIIGGLDRADSGSLIIRGRDTTNFSNHDWDAYRNNSVGFVFQSYNLISHLSIVQNVEMGMTLSGVNRKEKHERALQVLNDVGLNEHLHKNPTQLSGGQQQRVAIARALANDPEVLLCDEPTGALDTETSKQIMDLIREVSKDRLVIIVTHNPNIAATYADRTIHFSDGYIVSDSNPYEVKAKSEDFSIRKTAMNYWTALTLSFNNLLTKKGRTILTSFASSIGIIGIAVILALSSGFQVQIDKYQVDTLASMPITISRQASSFNAEDIATLQNTDDQPEEYADTDNIYIYDPADSTFIHTNVFTDEYLDYLQAIDPNIASSVGVVRSVQMNLIRDTGDEVIQVQFADTSSRPGPDSIGSASVNLGMSSYPTNLDPADEPYLEQAYDLIAGAYPSDATDLVLVIDSRNRINESIIKGLGFDTDKIETIDFDDLIGLEMLAVGNDDYYAKTQFGTYAPRTDYEQIYEEGDNLELRISGIIRQKEEVGIGVLSQGIAYSDELTQLIIDRSIDSEIVQAQADSETNVITTESFTNEEAKDNFMAYLGADTTPTMLLVYPQSFEAKDAVRAYLDDFNTGKDRSDQIIYTDLAATVSELSGGIMNAITLVLIAFASISLVVSLIMISIITYTSVLERTKEIGILRALGARKKDITRVFDAETFIIGVLSGILGIVIAYLLTIPINDFLYRTTELVNVATLRPDHAAFLVVISTVLTVIGGHIPAIMASRKDPVEALRSE